MKKNNYLIANILISLVIASRFIPEVGHYTPVFAVLILTAMIFEKKFMYIPFVGIFASDMLLEYFNYYEFSYLFSSLFFLNYLSYFLVYLVISNDNYNQKDSYSSILGNTIFNTIFAPTLFFILSNFVVWVTAGGIFYPYTLSGLFYCYEMGRANIHGLDHIELPAIADSIELVLANAVPPCRLIGIAINGRDVSDAEYVNEKECVIEAHGVPAVDVYREGAGDLVKAALKFREAGFGAAT